MGCLSWNLQAFRLLLLGPKTSGNLKIYVSRSEYLYDQINLVGIALKIIPFFFHQCITKNIYTPYSPSLSLRLLHRPYSEYVYVREYELIEVYSFGSGIADYR